MHQIYSRLVFQKQNQLCAKSLCAKVFLRSISMKPVNIDLPESNSLPRITYPHKMVLKLEKFKKRKLERYKEAYGRPRGNLIMSCSRKPFNLHEGRVTKETEMYNLVSYGWKNRNRRLGDYFTILASKENPSLQRMEIVSFEEIGIEPALREGLLDMGISTPTKIQARTVPKLLKGESVLCAAETGSGKTLSYLLPVIQRITHLKENCPSTTETESETYKPFGIIITPNRELTQQVELVATALMPFSNLSSCVFSKSTPRKPLRPHDLLITTPGALLNGINANLIDSRRLQHLVIDESDTLLDDSFIDDIVTIFRDLQISPATTEEGSETILGTQIVLVSATMPKPFQESLKSVFDIESLTKVTSHHLHSVSMHVEQTFIRVSRSSKPERLVRLTRELSDKKLTVLIFVNTAATCRFISQKLSENGVRNRKFHGELSSKERRVALKSLKDDSIEVIVATDIISRGIDTVNVNHVINYDFPSFMSDYVHRVGRVGRVGSSDVCHVTSFISQKWEVDLLWQIELAVRTGKKLEGVDANIKKAHSDRIFQKGGFKIQNFEDKESE